jgi:hypothetical protein
MSEKHFRPGDDVDLGYTRPISPSTSPGKSTLTAKLYRRASRDDNGVAAGADADVERAASSSGSALPGELRERFETSLGADLSGVRVHTGAESQTAATAVGARAYAVGNDIHFGAGQYDPSSQEGLFLIAHEVAHTVQQTGSTPTRQHKLAISTPGDAAEVEADRAAEAMVAGGAATVTGQAPSVLRRDTGDGGGSSVSDNDGAHGRDGGTDSSDSYEYKPDIDPNLPEGGATIMPPKPYDWSGCCPLPVSPSSPWKSAPAYEAEYDVPGNLETYRAAFDASWSEAKGSYNVVYKMHDNIRSREGQVPPILRIHQNSSVGAPSTHANATDAFQGEKVKDLKMDSGKVPKDVREKILTLKDDLTTSGNDVHSKKLTVFQCKGNVEKAEGSLKTARNSVKIEKTDAEITALGLDKGQVERELENHKAKIDAAVESVKAVTSIIKIFDPSQDPKDKVSNILGAVDQGATALGKIGEAALIHDANSKLADIDTRIGKLSFDNAALKVTNAETVVNGAKIDVKNAKAEVQKAINDLKNAQIRFDAKYRELATEMEKAGEKSGMSADQAKLLAAAVEAIPKIKEIVEFCKGMKGNIPVPGYTEASGIGAAMCSNVSEFTTNVGVIKGTGDYIGGIQGTWEGRLASVEAAIESATAMKTDW